MTYKDITTNNAVTSIPELILIPSDWRVETGTEDNNQGDHVTAYVFTAK